MFISFSVENFKSIRDLQTLSLEAQTEDRFEWSHVIAEGKHRLLKSVAIYGPNASGKSNVIQAMCWFRDFVINSSKEGQVGELIVTHPFRLSTATEDAPSHFEVEFFWQGFNYRYGFEVTARQIQSEWLFRNKPGLKAAKLFSREADTVKSEVFDVSPKFFKEGKGLEIRTRKNALFLSVCAQFNGEVSQSILKWFHQFRYLSGLNETGFFAFTASELQKPHSKEGLVSMAQRADLNIKDLRGIVEELNIDVLPEEVRKSLEPGKHRVLHSEIKTYHDKRDSKGKIVGTVEFDLATDGSQGTQKFIALTGPIAHTLEEGSILLVDELEARLHPKLTQAIIDLFHSPVNHRNAQLIFATHDVTLMEPERFRRDQIWFCEKDEAGATDLYCLADLDSNQVRPTTKFSRQYLQGLFGAVPKLAHFQEAAADATKN
jgi:AAA15 family ATPase/GTPase